MTSKILVLHGIGNHPDWWLERDVAYVPPEVLPRLQPFTWVDILNKSAASKGVMGLMNLLKAGVQGYAASQKEGWQQAAIVGGAEMLALPFLNFWLDRGADLLGYQSVREQAFARLETTLGAMEGDVTIIAHSMGSVLAFEYLCERGVPSKVKRFITAGSPLDRQPVRGRSMKRTGGCTRLPLPWLNLWGTQDPVCTWIPGVHGELNYYQPTEQIRIVGQHHTLEGYLKAIPRAWWG